MTYTAFNNFFPHNIITYISDRKKNFAISSGSEVMPPDQLFFLEKEIGHKMSSIATIRQVHGDDIKVIDDFTVHGDLYLGEADGILTQRANVALSIRTADCLSVFLYDEKTDSLGLLHAGWKSTYKRISEIALNLMKDKFGSKASDVKAAFGPSISAGHYQVEQEFCNYFPKETYQKAGKWHCDIAKANKNQLLKGGLKEKNIMSHSACTYENKNYFSYRRDGSAAGRMISIMMKKD